ncbi:MAG: hypothetical protein GBAus27B_000286 [Mycoplasmataceae bacterium]|nr:MAG: hypothetical protein GBAus27B_000286 [Mycoplasmataceae bacterium]
MNNQETPTNEQLNLMNSLNGHLAPILNGILTPNNPVITSYINIQITP